MAREGLRPHFKDAKAGKQVFLPPPPPKVVPLPVPVRQPSPPPISVVRQPLTPKTGMTRTELEERFKVASAIKAKLDALVPVSTEEPDTVYKILARQNTLVGNMNTLAGS